MAIARIECEIDRTDRKPAYRQLEDAIAARIRAGELKDGDRLPAESVLAKQLGISRMTVHHAYEGLQRRGMLEQYRAKGTFVTGPGDRRLQLGSVMLMMDAREAWTMSVIEQDYLHGFQQECARRGYTTTICFASRFSDARVSPGVGGICVLSAHMPEGTLPACPVILLSGGPEGAQIDWVHTDSTDGGRQAAEHLIELGHRRIGCYVRAFYHEGIELRVDSFRETVEAAGRPVNAAHFPEPGGRRTPQMQTVLSGPDRPTAVFCASDAAGLQLCGLAQELGLRVPRDLSLITYDGTSLTEVATPPLTAVYADRARAGRRAAEALIARIDGSASGPPREIITPVSLRVRCSTGPPAKE